MGSLTVVYGRFNPPTAGHEKLFSTAENLARSSVLRIYPTRTQDKKKNPLPFHRKLYYLNALLPQFSQYYSNDEKVKTIFDALTIASEEGFKKVQVIVGGDRLEEFAKLTGKYNGELYEIDDLEVISAGNRDGDANQTEGISASKARDAVRRNDYPTFSKCLPENAEEAYKQELFLELSSLMNDTTPTNAK